MERWGLAPAAVYDGEALRNLRGGVQIGSRYVGVLRLQLALDFERALGWRGASLMASGLLPHGGDVDELVGDAQGVSNLTAPRSVRVYELWLQQAWVEGQASTLVGRFDVGSEFYRLQAAGLFVNPSFGMGPEFSQSGQAGPSVFPETSLGIRLAYKPARGVVTRLAVLDGAPADRGIGTQRAFEPGDGLLVVAEQAFLSRPHGPDRLPSHRLRIGRGSGLPAYRHKLALGAWCYTARFDEPGAPPSAGRHLGSTGAYLVGDATLRAASAQQRGKINVFAQLGAADPHVNRFNLYVGAGVVASGLVAALANDELGFAVAWAHNGSQYVAAQRDGGTSISPAETAFELTYLFQIGGHLALQPDFQYVLRPSSNATTRDSLIAALRFELSL